MAAAGLRLAATVDKIIAVARAFDGKDTPGNQSPSRGEPELSSLSFSDLPMTLNNSQVVRPSQRANILSRTRNLKMARDAHAYVRGSTERFYEWLEAEAAPCLPDRQYGFAAIAISAISGRSPMRTDILTFKFAISTRPSLEIRRMISSGSAYRWLPPRGGPTSPG